MDKIITLIKREINKNNFWTITQGDEQLDNARKTMYTHIIKMRTQEVDNALTIRDGDIAEIEVRKTDIVYQHIYVKSRKTVQMILVVGQE